MIYFLIRKLYEDTENSTFLIQGALIDMVGGDDNDTPLHDAVANTQLEAARLLINRYFLDNYMFHSYCFYQCQRVYHVKFIHAQYQD